jgi:hypothetical protein
VEDIFGPVVFRGCFPVPEGMEAYAQDPWVLEFVGDFAALFVE